MELHIAAGLYRQAAQLETGKFANMEEYVASISFGGFTAGDNIGNAEPWYWFDDKTNSSYNCAGVPNPGFSHFCEHELAPISARLPSSCRLVVNLIPKQPGDIAQMCQVAKSCEPLIDVVEINVACPNLYADGEHKGVLAHDADAVERAVQESATFTGERWLKIAPRTSRRTLMDIVDICFDRGISAIVSGNTEMVSSTIRSEQRVSMPMCGQAGGLLLEPALQQYEILRELVAAKGNHPNILPCGGVMNVDALKAYAERGATEVALGTYAQEFGTAGARDLLTAL